MKTYCEDEPAVERATSRHQINSGGLGDCWMQLGRLLAGSPESGAPTNMRLQWPVNWPSRLG